jgi:uncharacterized protein YegL
MTQTPYSGSGSSFEFHENTFFDNPEPRVPCVLLLDVSGSMQGNPIHELNEGIKLFKDELMADPLTVKRAEPAIITFGNTVEMVHDFATVESFSPSALVASGLTPMGEAVSLALDKLASRKETYRQNGISYYRPWIFLITDGGPTDSWQSAAKRAIAEQNKKACSLFAVGVEGANLDILKEFSAKEPLRLKELRFRDLFKWLSSSLKSVSRSTPGEEVGLDNPVTPTGWAKV